MKQAKDTIKIVVTDIDGTLFSHQTKVMPVSAIKAIQSLQAKGIKVFLASSRNRYLIHKLGILDSIKPDGLITMNGANAIIDGRIIHRYPLPESEVDALIKFLSLIHI